MKISPLGVLFVLCLLIHIHSQDCLLQYEYQDQNGLCQPCYHKCLTCIDSSQLCDSCNSEYYLDPSTHTCQPCLKGCSVCQNSTSCSSCIVNFYLNANGSCSTCTIGAQTCTISTISQCISNYYLLNSICAKCLDNCKVCNNSVTCQYCQDGYYLNGTLQCSKCGSNCDRCSSTSSCSYCSKGYQPNSGSNDCSVCNGTGNSIYSDATSNCIICTNYCLKCDQSICYYCEQGYILSEDQTQCSQGGSILCYQSKGYGYTECQVDINGCPNNTHQQYDTSLGYQVPTTVCLPKSYTSSSQFVYDTFSCSSQTSTYTFTSSAKYEISTRIQLLIPSPIPSTISLSYGSQSSILTIPASVSSHPIISSSCGNYILWNTEVNFTGTASSISVQTSNVYITEIYIQNKLCTVTNCKTCTTNLDCTSCEASYYLQLNQCVQECDTGFYTYLANMTCHITCPDTTYPISSQYLCEDCNQNNCYLCTSLSVCLSCKPGFYLYNSTCISSCETESSLRYYADEDTNVCRLCPFPCGTCKVVNNITSCFSCNVGYLLNNQCIFVCPNGTYPVFNSILICEDCNSASPYYCSTCTINSTVCTSCINPYYLHDSQCEIACPQGYYSDNYICYSCQSPCLKCIGSPTNCSTCNIGNYNFDSLTSVGSCLSVCPNGTYSNYTDTLNPLCSSCSSECTRCYGATSSECLSCSNSYYLYGSECLSACTVDTTYQNSVDNICSPCNAPCKTCLVSNGSACTSCTIGFLSEITCSLVCNQTSYPLLTSTIYICTQCPLNCYSCISATNCKSCIAPYQLFQSSCIDPKDCPESYYNDTFNLLCTKCLSPCDTCSNSISCITCIIPYYFYNNSCVTTCPDGTLLNVDYCEACDPQCLTCSQTKSNCTSCFSYNNQLTYFYQNTCITTCPDQFYADSSESTCEACSLPCLTCWNLYLCSSCADSSQFLYDNQCIDECPTDTLPINKQCKICTNFCLTCSLDVANCTSCSQLYYYYFNDTTDFGSCLPDCPDYYYEDSYSGSCSDCISPCLTCSSQITCLSCITSYSLFIGSCIQNCPTGYFSSSQICTICISPCNECASATNCTLCSVGYYMPYGQTWTQGCLTTCPIGQFAQNFTQSCALCNTDCSNCSSLSVCYNCTGASYLYLSSCLSECPSGYYPQNNICNPCAYGCSRCISSTICSSCIGLYNLYNHTCVASCPLKTYSAISIYENIFVCFNCSSNCLECTDYYQCSKCDTGFFIQNGQCISECSTFYYQQASSCLPCGFSCSRCLNATYCLNCSNTYIWSNFCYSLCPATTYSNYTNMNCVKCVSPCLTCINNYSCLSCVEGYKFYQSICVESCPNNTWLYNNQCVAECTKYKDYETNTCYDQCPIYKVAQNSICLSQCPIGTYVSTMRVCTECQNQCQYLFKGQLQFVGVSEFRLVLYFNQRASDISYDQVIVSITEKQFQKRLLLQYPLLRMEITDRSIQFVYDIQSSKMLEVTLQIPYILSKDTEQSISSNTFVIPIYNYHKPKPLFNFKIIGYLVSVLILILFVTNLVYGTGHYQAVLELAQIFCMLNYLQIYYPWPLYQFYEGLQLLMFAPVVSIYSPYIYSFSPSKFINYNFDNQFFRNSLSMILFIILPIAALVGSICLYTHLKREIPQEHSHKFLRFCRVIKNRLLWRYLNDCFFVSIVWIGVFSVSTFNNHPNKYTIFSYVIASVSILVVVAIVVFIFYIVLKNVKKKKRSLQQIEGLVEDLEVDTSTLGLMYTPILYLRKILLICLVGLYSTFPISSLFMLMVLSALLLVILFFYKPFKNPITDHITVALEVCLIVTIFLLVIIKMNEDILSDSARFGIGLTVTVLDVLILMVAVGWWGYLTITDYVMRSKFIFGAVEKESENDLQNSKIKENKLQISNALNDLTNIKHTRKFGSELGGSKSDNEGSVYNIHKAESSEENHSASGSQESKDLFKHYHSQSQSQKDYAMPSRLKKQPIRQQKFEQQFEQKGEQKNKEKEN